MSFSLSTLEHDLHEKLFLQLEKEQGVSSVRGFGNEAYQQSFYDLLRRAERLFLSDSCVVPPHQKDQLLKNVVYRVIGLGVIQPLLEEPSITEIMVNGPDHIFIERDGKIQPVDLCFSSVDDLLHVIQRVVSRIGRRIDESSPMVDARLPDGSRVNAIIPPLSLVGPVLTIRKFPEKVFTLEMLEGFQSINAEMSKYLAACVREKKNMIISGGTGSGKTSLLNALSSVISPDERIVTIEDSAEIRLNHPHLISLESRPPNIEGRGEVTIRTLLKNALRMRPDRIIVGEIRGAEALDMLQAMNTGHKGSLTTIHANAPLEALLRAETMVLMAQSNLPLAAVRSQICKAIDVVVQLERDVSGKRRVTKISELSERVDDAGVSHYEMKEVYTVDGRQ